MTPPIALVVGPIFFEDAKWQALAPEVTLKVFSRSSSLEPEFTTDMCEISGVQKRHKRGIYFPP
jgi:hypothetical protein